MQVDGDFLSALGEKAFDGRVETTPDGGIKTKKPDSVSHGFGLAQMRTAVEKYDSILSVS